MAQRQTNESARQTAGLPHVDAWPMAMAIGWVLVTGMFFWLAWPDTAVNVEFAAGRLLLVLIAVFIPAVLILFAAITIRAMQNFRYELHQMRAGINQIAYAQASHAKYLADQATAAPSTQAPVQQDPHADPAQPNIAEPSKADVEQPVSRFSSRREVSRLITPRAAPQPAADQAALALDTPQEKQHPPIERPDLIKALHFPDDENDTEGFAALRRALRDLNARKLVQASQDVLTLLSQDGIYMDDLRPNPVSAQMWRRFANGERGKAVDAIGGIRDQAHLSVISKRMREDTIFRDSVHHFLRCFDQLLVTFEANATDTDLLELAETRTSRAFMVLARATGTFD